MPVIECCKVGRVKLFPLCRKLAPHSLAVYRKIDLPVAVRDFASVFSGGILISEVVDAPVIMGIPKPVDLKI